MSIAANLVSRGAVAVYGLTSSLYLFTRVQHHKAAAQDFSSRFLAEEGKVTGLTQELNKTKEQLRVALETAPLAQWPEPAAVPEKPNDLSGLDSAACMLLGTMVGGFIGVAGGLGK